jgi:hypothetical protein
MIKRTAKEFWEDAWTIGVEEIKQLHGDSYNLSDLRQSVRTTKANPDGENATWWFENGQKFVESWINWREGSGWKLWTTPERQPAIEMKLEIKTGGIWMQGGVDRVFVTPDGELVILDLKTGMRSPQSDLQLSIYACMMERAIGVRPSWGTYWMARQGTTTPPVNLESMTLQKLDELVALFEKARKEKIFLPNFDGCKMCSVIDFCYWKNGNNSEQLGEISVK